MQQKVGRSHQQKEEQAKDAEGVPPADGRDEPLGQWQEDHLAQRVAGIGQAQHPAAAAREPGGQGGGGGEGGNGVLTHRRQDAVEEIQVPELVGTAAGEVAMQDQQPAQGKQIARPDAV